MLSKGVDYTPERNDQGIEEFLATAGAAEPELTREKNDREKDSIRNERAPHDEMCETLSEMIVVAESQRGNSAKEHLHPGHDGHRLAHQPVK